MEPGCEPPEYPLAAILKGAEGTSRISIFVDADGHPTKVRIDRTSGDTLAHKLLDLTASEYLSRCNFEPASIDNVPIASWVAVQYNWKLHKSGDKDSPARPGRMKPDCEPPEYPPLAVNSLTEGNSLIGVFVKKDGQVTKVRVEHSSGDTPTHKLLDYKASEYLARCEFEPASDGSSAIDSWVSVSYDWKLE